MSNANDLDARKQVDAAIYELATLLPRDTNSKAKIIEALADLDSKYGKDHVEAGLWGMIERGLKQAATSDQVGIYSNISDMLQSFHTWHPESTMGDLAPQFKIELMQPHLMTHGYADAAHAAHETLAAKAAGRDRDESSASTAASPGGESPKIKPV